MSKQPQVLWAQRESVLFLTIEVDEAKIEELKGEGNKLHFQGSSKTDKYEATLEFFDEIDPASVKHTGSSTRVIEITIQKKTPGWWPRLLQTKAKAHWLKVDFGKWKDEDEDADEAEEAAGASGLGNGMGNGFDLNQYMSSLGGAGGADFGGLEDEEDDEVDFPEEGDVYNPNGQVVSDMPDLEDNDEETEAGKADTKA
uniref:CS domain-containing protein n=1 Tax=Caenorhabditis tropicalis TaxID=1561998 RepID=A0A1I7V556_9PELO